MAATAELQKIQIQASSVGIDSQQSWYIPHRARDIVQHNYVNKNMSGKCGLGNARSELASMPNDAPTSFINRYLSQQTKKLYIEK